MTNPGRVELAGLIFGSKQLENSQPTNQTITVTAVALSDSEDGAVDVILTEDVVGDNTLEEGADVVTSIPTTVSVMEGDELIVTMYGGSAKDVVVTGKVGEGDMTEERLRDVELESLKVENLTAEQLEATNAYIETLTAGNLEADQILADHASVGELEADHVSVGDLQAAEARIGTLEADHVSVSEFDAEKANIDNLQAATADIDTIRANAAKVQNLTAAQLEADHATIGTLDTTYMHADMSNSDVAWIQNGTIKNGAISNAMINDVSASKLTAGTIDASSITVTNLNADNITAGTINGERIGQGSLSLDKLSEDVYTETEVDAKLSSMQDQIDGSIETWTGTAVPTLNNKPASDWKNAADRDKHVGDVYFVVNSDSQQNGYNYRFTKSGSSYSWQLIKDSDVTQALQRLTTAEGKITTFDSDISTLKTDTGTLKTKTQSLETSLGDKVDVTTFNEVSDTVSQHSQSITQMNTAISNKADGSTVSALTTRVSKNEQDISGITTSIGQLTETVETKADGSTVETLRSEYNETKTTVAGHETRLTATESVANGVRTDLDNLEIGGRNLFQTNSLVVGYLTATGSIYNNQANGERTSDFIEVSASEKYTLQYWTNPDLQSWICLQWFDSSQKFVSQALRKGLTADYFAMAFTAPPTAAYARISARWLADGTARIKFEKGNTATDWTPAPEDIQTEVTEFKADYATYKQTTTESLSSIGTRMTTAEGKITAAETSIEQNASDILLRATKTEAQNYANQAAHPKLSPFFEYQPVEFDNNPYWLFISNPTDHPPRFTDEGNGWCHIVKDNSDGTKVSRNDFDMAGTFEVKPGTDYTILIELRNSSGTKPTSGAATTYVVASARRVQFYGNTIKKLIQGSTSNTSVDIINLAARSELCDDGVYRKRFVKTSEPSESTYLNRDGELALMTLVLYVPAGGVVDVEMRVSIYEGEYTGPYKPYAGVQLYSSRSELEVTSDGIIATISNTYTTQSDFDELSDTVGKNAEDVSESLQEIGDDISGINAAVNSVTKTANDTVSTLESWFKFATEGEGESQVPLLELGTTGGASDKSKLKLTSQALKFLYDNVDVAKIQAKDGSGVMTITKAEIEEELIFGSWLWEERANHNMTLKWIGSE